MEQIYGYVESIVFAGEESGFTVARLKEANRRELTSIVGVLPGLQPGETICCRGEWKHHAQHGRQFEVSQFEVKAPSDLVGIQKYLESGLIKGIGPAYAKRIVDAFGLKTLEIIDQSPERLRGVDGIGQKRVEKIMTCWQEQKSIRTVMIFLRTHGVSPAYAQKIFKTYGEESIEKVKSNPFALARHVFGIGFKMADQIANRLGIAFDAPSRIDAGIEHLLLEFSEEGHVCYPREDLVQRMLEMLGVAQPLIEERLQALLQEERLFQKEIGGKIFLWLRYLYLSEIGIAKEIERLLSHASPLRSIHLEKALEWVQEKLHLKLAPEQKTAVACTLSEKLHIITGGPGTGKSTITKAILRITEKLTDRIILAAPTGRAAKRMTEITRRRASTIHSLLEFSFEAKGFKKNRENPLQCDLIIIDEVSMIDTSLMYQLLKAIPSTSRVILIGDMDQLPSVGPGNVLKDLLESEKINFTQLKQVFRQGKHSEIAYSAQRINQGFFPLLTPSLESDFRFLEAETPEEISSLIVKLVASEIPQNSRFDRIAEIQVLSPMRKGQIGSENLNILLQKSLNSSPSFLSHMGRAFHLNDKVMQIRNNYNKHVFNGDVGKIVDINDEDQLLTIQFDEKTVPYEFSELDEIVLAYAVSIHKYQGSECPCIIIPVHTSHFKLLTRNLIYTGVTRGKKLVILVGSKKALGMAISNEEVRKRFTGLKQAL